ncbi:MAG: type II toxin-antitoxin system HicB family antitoxin [Candidatus Nitrosopolaris sp.]|jgi:predicted RNase H-like HicB family nuclease
MQYHILIKTSPEGGYTGQCLELPGAISEGETLEELQRNIAEAIDLVQEEIRHMAKSEQVIELTH